jgi:NADH/NAD ratio-sensing transcriptional regulator Rex
MDAFLYAYNQSKLNQEDINHLNRLISSNEIETVIENLPTGKAQDLMDSLLNFIKPLQNF